MTPARRDGALCFDLTLPSSVIRLGPVSIDAVKAALGVDLADILSSLMRGPKSQRTSGAGVVDVYPLAIPQGEGISIPVKRLGEIGLRNVQSLLVLIVPAAVAEVVREQLAREIAAKQAAGPRFREGAGGYNAEFAIRLKPGMRKAVPLGALGELGVEAA